MKIKDIEERNKKIVALRQEGMTVTQLSELYNLTVTHILRILQNAK